MLRKEAYVQKSEMEEVNVIIVTEHLQKRMMIRGLPLTGLADRSLKL